MIEAKKRLKDYFEDDEEGKQLEALPRAWMDGSRFKVGDQIRYLDSLPITVKGERQNLRGQIGAVLEIRNGYGQFPSRWVGGDYQFWDGQHEGWLVVRFPFDCYGLENDGVTAKPRACTFDDEGIVWEKV